MRKLFASLLALGFVFGGYTPIVSAAPVAPSEGISTVLKADQNVAKKRGKKKGKKHHGKKHGGKNQNGKKGKGKA